MSSSINEIMLYKIEYLLKVTVFWSIPFWTEKPPTSSVTPTNWFDLTNRLNLNCTRWTESVKYLRHLWFQLCILFQLLSNLIHLFKRGSIEKQILKAKKDPKSMTYHFRIKDNSPTKKWSGQSFRDNAVKKLLSNSCFSDDKFRTKIQNF